MLTAPKYINTTDSFESLMAGAKIICDAVTATMGPRGRLVTYRQPGVLYPVATKDGVSVARMCFLRDPEENIGAMMMMQAANRQVRDTGDGTTLVCLLAYKIMCLIWAGHNPAEIEKVLHDAIKRIEKLATPCTDVKTLSQVATIAANGDEQLGAFIAEAVYKTGKNGIVLCEKSPSNQTYIEYQNGYQFQSGIQFSDFINAPQKGAFETDSPLIVVTDHELAWGTDVRQFLEKVIPTPAYQSNPRPIVIFSPDVKDEVLQIFVKNFKQLPICPIKPFGIGTERKACLADIAAITGATYVTDESGIRINDITFEMLGTCKKISSRNALTVIVGDRHEKDRRIESLKVQLENTKNDEFQASIIRNSIAKLSGAVAVVFVGGYSETEQRETMDRVDDAIRAAKSAMEEGVVPGGGVTLLQNIEGFPDLSRAPITKILQNAGLEESEIDHIVRVLETTNGAGYKIDSPGTLTEENMSELGIIDPVKVVRTAILNAFSVAKTMSHVSVIITPLEEKNVS